MIRKLIVVVALLAAPFLASADPAAASHLSAAERAWICNSGEPWGQPHYLYTQEVSTNQLDCVGAYGNDFCTLWVMLWYGGWNGPYYTHQVDCDNYF